MCVYVIKQAPSHAPKNLFFSMIPPCLSCCLFFLWCGFCPSVDHEKVFEGLRSLHEQGIRPKWLVLDDGWQSTSNVDAANGGSLFSFFLHLTALFRATRSCSSHIARGSCPLFLFFRRGSALHLLPLWGTVYTCC